jgi:hypothetical protein
VPRLRSGSVAQANATQQLSDNAAGRRRYYAAARPVSLFTAWGYRVTGLRRGGRTQGRVLRFYVYESAPPRDSCSWRFYFKKSAVKRPIHFNMSCTSSALTLSNCP